MIIPRAASSKGQKKNWGNHESPSFDAEPGRSAIHPGAAGDASLSRLVNPPEGAEHRLQHADIPFNLAVDRRKRISH